MQQKNTAGGLYDMHTHSRHSHDSDCSVADMAASAAAKGLAGFAVTDHCDIEFCRDRDVFSPIAASVAAVTQLAAAPLSVLRGVEIGEGLWFPAEAARIATANPYDVVIGSVHAVRFPEYTQPYSLIDFSVFSDAALSRFMDTYFDDMQELLRVCDFDILAHMTCPLRYIRGKYGRALDCRRYRDKITAILDEIIRRGIALEVNTSCLDSGYDALMPETWILQLYRARGGMLLTIGSDAHIAENAAHDFPRALEKIRECGFSQLQYYRNRKAVPYTF